MLLRCWCVFNGLTGTWSYLSALSQLRGEKSKWHGPYEVQVVWQGSVTNINKKYPLNKYETHNHPSNIIFKVCQMIFSRDKRKNISLQADVQLLPCASTSYIAEQTNSPPFSPPSLIVLQPGVALVTQIFVWRRTRWGGSVFLACTLHNLQRRQFNWGQTDCWQ